MPDSQGPGARKKPAARKKPVARVTLTERDAGLDVAARDASPPPAPPAAPLAPAAKPGRVPTPLVPLVDEAEHGLIALLQRRPTETVSGAALAATVYGFLTQAGLASIVAAVIAVAIAFVPGAVSATVDHLRK